MSCTVRAAPSRASLSSGHKKQVKHRGLGRPPSAQTEGTTAAQRVPENPEEAATDINPLNDGPCGDLWSGNCWVSQTLLAGSLTAGAAIPILIFRYCDSAELQLFLWGCLLGLTWEAPLSAPGFMDNPSKLLRLLRPASLLQLGIWSAWDGGICMIGHWSTLALGLSLQQEPWAALAVHVLWGQASSLLVETVAAMSGMWAYTPSRRNPSLLQLPNGSHLTALPQAIWLYASVFFSSFAGRLHELP